ncbi:MULTISPECIES: TULIP family P47-like protein [Nostoc]|uniref:TULIP family P47-like protein n=1 Tax=Nostoc paludosum FACHB-159 TaxID=2692908 RepID=A0ABR8K2C4_9NOSO|nr:MULTISPECIES: TULIP family P47-like protein [Nostoc]MBD2677205.1 TULIP family P47-like protein [Nostoc sp. FACHB-857]MBD2732986.1 TULIP family P47-like protein [Nostoc paludosum FACHB-159]
MTLQDLQGYDLVMAITEKALNEQFALVFQDNTLPQWNAELSDDGSTIQATFGIPRIDLNTPLNRGASLIVPIVAGAYTYYQVKIVSGKPEVTSVSYDLSGKSFVLTSSLKMLHDTDFHSADFTVQRLFLDLSDPHLVSRFEIDDIDGQALVSITTLLQKYLEQLQKQNNATFVFGSVKVPNVPETVGPLAPTGGDFSVYSDPSNPQFNCLNFLLMTDKKLLPTEPTAGIFDHSLVLTNDEATFIASDYQILSKFILPNIVNGLKSKDVDCPISVDSFNLSHNPAKATLKENVPFKGCSFTKLDVYISNNEIAMDIEYRKKGHIGPAITITGIANLSNYVSIYVENGELKYKTRQTDIKVSSDQDNLAVRIILDILTAGFLEIGYKVVTDAVKHAVNNLLKDNGFSNALTNAMACVELPAKSLFEYSNVQLPANFMLDVTLKN